ncbi:hypothetical protein [Halopiger thermotolerans]
MGKKPTVAFRVEADTKAEWSEAVEQSDEYASMSHLIKKAVNRELAGAYDRDTGGGSGVSDAKVSEIVEHLEALEATVSGLDDDVSDATDALHASSGVDDELPIDVFKALPEGEDNAVTVAELSDMTGRKEPAVRFALTNIKRNTGAIRKVEPMRPEGDNDGVEAGQESGVIEEPRWYKVEGA